MALAIFSLILFLIDKIISRTAGIRSDKPPCDQEKMKEDFE